MNKRSKLWMITISILALVSCSTDDILNDDNNSTNPTNSTRTNSSSSDRRSPVLLSVDIGRTTYHRFRYAHIGGRNESWCETLLQIRRRYERNGAVREAEFGTTTGVFEVSDQPSFLHEYAEQYSCVGRYRSRQGKLTFLDSNTYLPIGDLYKEKFTKYISGKFLGK